MVSLLDSPLIGTSVLRRFFLKTKQVFNLNHLSFNVTEDNLVKNWAALKSAED